MSILDHIDELRKRLVRMVIAIAAISLFTFTFGFQEFTIQGTQVLLPFPNPFNNSASQAINMIERDVLPDYVSIIVTAPSQALIAQLYFSLFLGIIFGMPVIIREFSKFFGPALYPNERKRITRLALPATFLFLLGAGFSYIYITPFTLDFLYRYGVGVVNETFITIDSFISFVLLFTLAFGLSFELPVLMWVVTATGVVDPEFWRKNVSYVVVVLAVYGAVITPDGSGITMWFVAGPMLLLYILGYFLIRRSMGKKKETKKV
jgi:sec-independent protein translocase protein TatC